MIYGKLSRLTKTENSGPLVSEQVEGAFYDLPKVGQPFRFIHGSYVDGWRERITSVVKSIAENPGFRPPNAENRILFLTETGSSYQLIWKN